MILLQSKWNLKIVAQKTLKRLYIYCVLVCWQSLSYSVPSAGTWMAPTWATHHSGCEWRWAQLWSQSLALPSTEPSPDKNDWPPTDQRPHISVPQTHPPAFNTKPPRAAPDPPVCTWWTLIILLFTPKISSLLSTILCSRLLSFSVSSFFILPSDSLDDNNLEAVDDHIVPFLPCPACSALHCLAGLSMS